MHKINGNMSSQHRKENVGRKNIIKPEISRNKFLSLCDKKIKKMTDEELTNWLNICLVLEEWFKPSGKFRKLKRKWVQRRIEAENELGKRNDSK